MSKGFIPMQQLTDRRSQPIPFLSWVDAGAIGETLCHPCTLYQLLETCHAVLQGLGLRFSEDHGDAFHIEYCPRGVFVIPPRLFLQCSQDPKTFLCFDWFQWITSTNYVLAESNHQE